MLLLKKQTKKTMLLLKAPCSLIGTPATMGIYTVNQSAKRVGIAVHKTVHTQVKSFG